MHNGAVVAILSAVAENRVCIQRRKIDRRDFIDVLGEKPKIWPFVIAAQLQRQLLCKPWRAQRIVVRVIDIPAAFFVQRGDFGCKQIGARFTAQGMAAICFAGRKR